MRLSLSLALAAASLAAAPSPSAIAVDTPEQAIAAAEKACGTELPSAEPWQARLDGEVWIVTKSERHLSGRGHSRVLEDSVTARINKHNASDAHCSVIIATD